MPTYITTCKRCKTTTSTLASRLQYADANLGALVYDKRGETGVYGALALPCRGCGKLCTAKLVRAVVRQDHKCDARCEASRGNVCECSCGGANHGRNFAA